MRVTVYPARDIIYVEDTDSIELVAQELVAKSRGNRPTEFHLFNGRKIEIGVKDIICSTLDDAYIQLVGINEQEYILRSKDALGKVFDWIKEGKELLPSNVHDEWEKFVVEQAASWDNGHIVDTILKMIPSYKRLSKDLGTKLLEAIFPSENSEYKKWIQDVVKWFTRGISAKPKFPGRLSRRRR